MISSRSLDDLSPATKLKAQRHIALCSAIGIELLIYCTYRDFESQNSLYAQGRSKPGAVVTNAKAGESYHNWHVAYDCVPLVNGKPAWEDRALTLKVGELGESIGLDWSGRWIGKLQETAHFQLPGVLTLADLKAGKVPL